MTFRYAFLTKERILFAPRLPYKADLSYTVADDRYPSYTDAVYRSAQVVYVSTNLPALDAVLRDRFAEVGITFREHHIGPYTIFYDLSDPVTPEDIDLYAHLGP